MSKDNTEMISRLLDVNDSAAFLGVSVATIRRWTHIKRLAGIKVGIRGDWRFAKADLLRMIKKTDGIEQNTRPGHEINEPLQLGPSSFPAPNSSREEIRNAEHFVQYYESDTAILNSLSSFIGAGIKQEDLCIIVSTNAHKKKLDERLQVLGLDVTPQGTYLFLNAYKTIAKYFSEGRLSRFHLFALLEGIITSATKKGQKVRIFCEMVAILWEEGNHQGALQLERLWNDLALVHVFSLFCAYPIQIFDEELHSDTFNHIGTIHTRVIPTERYNDLKTNDERLRAIAILQQKAEALQKEVVERKKLERLKDDFISMASHELKTPVTSLMAYTHVLENRMTQKGQEEEAHYLKRMESQIRKLTNLISDLLDVSKMHTGKMRFTKTLFPIDILVKEIVEQVQITTKTHSIVLEGTTHVVMWGDRDRLGQVLINLLINALKYSPRGKKVVVTLYTEKDNVKIGVQDFGIGIDKHKQKKIFERFYQIADMKEKTYPGLGIGLYIAQQIVVRHRGEIQVESEKGKGAVFTLVLPVNRKH